jgi:hypothetical protein
MGWKRCRWQQNLASWVGCLLLTWGTFTPLHGQRMSQSWKPVVYAHHAGGTGTASLRASASELIRTGSPRQVIVREVSRFIPATDSWEPLPIRLPASFRVPVPKPRQVYSQDTDQVLLVIPEPVGLFWVEWEEEGHRLTSFMYAGPILCEDVMLGPAPPGQVAVCVPFADRAQASFVPDAARP